MKKKLVFLAAAVSAFSAFTSCIDNDLESNTKKASQTSTNFENRFGVSFDSNQDWSCVNSNEVTITANADLDNIVKVQVLTESPFLNSETRVLNEAETKNGGLVTLSYSAPTIYERLVAACVDANGVYRIQVFNVGDKEVQFQSSAATRAEANEMPDFTTIKLRAPQKSANARRAASSDAKFSAWQGSKWNDEMWEIADGQTFTNGWKMDSQPNRGVVYRDLNGFDEGEQATVEAIINDFLFKYDKSGWNGKKNNLSSVRNSANFSLNDNYVITDGVNPVTLIPLQAYTDEFKLNHIFYYYFKPEDIPAGMDEVEYIKQLPKFKAIQVERIQTTAEKNVGQLYRRQEFLLPFYKNAPVQGDNEASAIFPKGYKIGFLNAKNEPTGTFKIDNIQYGCTYGDGRLNYELNHFGQYLSAMDKSLGGKVSGGMNYTDPRIAVFSANGKTYMCFEEGADCNFSDMVIEIGSGTQQVEEEIEPEAAAYTMCFEDRPEQADYDMNDVVLRATRLSETRIQLSVIACGAYDPVTLGGIQGREQWRFNGSEVHELFGFNYGEKVFINTKNDIQHFQPISEWVEVDKSVSIEEFLKSIYIVNENTGTKIGVPEKGEPPYAVIVPLSFKYPLEGHNITKAYIDFLNWAVDINSNGDWYMFSESESVYPDYFSSNQ